MTYIQYLKGPKDPKEGGKKLKILFPTFIFIVNHGYHPIMQTEIQTMPFHTSTCPPKTPDIKQSGGYISFSLPIDYSLIFSLHISFTLSCHISNKPAQNAHTHPPHIHQISSYHTDTQGSPITGSVEDGCHGSTSRAMLPHDQKGDAAEPAPFLCSAPAVIKKDIITGQRKEINYYVTLVFRTPYMKQL